MKKSFKKIFASFLAISTLAVGMTGLNASAATDSASWDIRYSPGAPGNVTYRSVSIISYGGGYRNHTSSISGSNDRSVSMSSGGTFLTRITTTGYTSTFRIATSNSTISFTFSGNGSYYAANGVMGQAR